MIGKSGNNLHPPGSIPAGYDRVRGPQAPPIPTLSALSKCKSAGEGLDFESTRSLFRKQLLVDLTPRGLAANRLKSFRAGARVRQKTAVWCDNDVPDFADGITLTKNLALRKLCDRLRRSRSLAAFGGDPMPSLGPLVARGPFVQRKKTTTKQKKTKKQSERERSSQHIKYYGRLFIHSCRNCTILGA